jgi:hypothetical protein
MIQHLPGYVRPRARRALANDDVIIGNLLQEVMASGDNRDKISKFPLHQINEFVALLREVCHI